MTDKFLTDLTEKLRTFAKERDWEQFHTPKNLAMALSVEVAELQEIFQWLEGDASFKLNQVQRAQASHEIADVLLYLVRLADVLDIDMEEAARQKLQLNAQKYPADQVRGKSAKYTAYETDSDA